MGGARTEGLAAPAYYRAREAFRNFLPQRARTGAFRAENPGDLPTGNCGRWRQSMEGAFPDNPMPGNHCGLPLLAFLAGPVRTPHWPPRGA